MPDDLPIAPTEPETSAPATPIVTASEGENNPAPQQPVVIDMELPITPQASFRPAEGGINTPQQLPEPPPLKRPGFNKDGSPRKSRGSKGASAMPNKNVPTDQMLIDSCAAIADITAGSLATIIGPEWLLEPTERAQLSIVGAAYMKSKNMDDISPGAMLAVCIAAVASKRLKEPNTMDKLKLYGALAYNKVKGLLFRR